jgi:DNA-binding response OmpR family regulator
LLFGALSAAPAQDPPRIIVAEDDAPMRQLVVEALRKDGYEVSAVSDGGQLLVSMACRLTHCGGLDVADLVLSDVRMPICSGMQILERLRGARCQVPVILMTAFDDAEARARAYSLGAVLLDKPFALEHLRRVVAALLRRGE